MDEQLSYATCANLVDYPDSAGPVGTQLRPEIAAAMPTVSRDGRTYTFRIRPGFRFSPPSNEPVTAATFRHTIERTLSRFAQNWPYAPDIVGVRSLPDGQESAHIAGISARGMTLSITLAKPAGDFLVATRHAVLLPGAALDSARPEARARNRSLRPARTTSPRSSRTGSCSCGTRTTPATAPGARRGS